MQKSSIIRLFYGLWTVFTLILTIIVLMLPLIVWIFWNEVISYGMIPIFILLGLLLPLAIFGLVIFIRIFQAYHHKSSIHPRRNIVFKLLPILILGTVFGGYWYFFPGWIYDVGMPPQYGPYISLHAKGGMQISWDTAFPTPSEVQYGFSENNLSLTEYGGDYYWQTDPTLKSTHHCVLLSHLESNCTVYYTIPGFDNHIYQFQTPPLDNQIQKVTFTIQGDTQGNFNIQKQNIALIRVITEHIPF